jgi:UDP-arabinose 4-epimerase
MRILVTGGAGYIGSHTAKLLHGRGHQPVVLDDLSTGHEDLVRFGPFERGDIRDEERVMQVLLGHRIEAVIHFAAKALVPESLREPALYTAVNAGGTASLLAAMQRAGVKRLVFSGSCAVYGPARFERIAEDHPFAPISPYGETKLQAERAIAAAPFGLRWAVLRYFNVIGADPGGELAERHEPETHVLPNLLRAARDGRPFTLFGDNHSTPDGSAVRDYVDVCDLGRVHLDALEALDTRERLVSNVGTGEGVSVRQLLAAVERVLGRRVTVRVEPPREGDPPRLVADNAHLLTWSASARQGFTPLETSVRNAWNAMQAPA